MKKLTALFLVLGFAVSAMAFTPFPPVVTPPDVLVTKGGLLTSTGAAQVEFTACADDEIILFDAADPNGFKCTAVPSQSPTTTEGDLIVRGATVDERLAPGTAGQLMTSNGAGVKPSYQDAPVALPVQTGDNGRILQTDGTSADWVDNNQEVNYITNSGAESTANTWVSFKSSTTASYPQDFSGTPDLGYDGMVRNIGSPLRGTASWMLDLNMLLAPAATDHGSYYSFVVSPGDLDSRLSVCMAYDFSMVEYLDGDLVMFVYDEDKSEFIRFSGEGVPAGKNNNYCSSFVTDAVSDNYRIGFYYIGTGEGFTPKFDSLEVGIPKSGIAQFDISMTDWKDFPFVVDAQTSSPVKGTILKDEARYRRIGDSMEVTVDYQQSTGGSAGSGVYLIPLPDNLEADLTKIGSSSSYISGVVGGGIFKSAGGVEIPVKFAVYAADPSKLVVQIQGNSGANIQYSHTAWSSTYFGLGNVDIGVSGKFTVPIKGWTVETNTVITQDTELTAKTANEFSFNMSDTGIVSDDSYDFINGNCVRTDQTAFYRYNCTLNDLNITQPLTCVVSSRQGSGLYLVAEEANGSTTTNIQLTSQFSNSNTILAGAMNVACQKSDVDLNKSQTIVGKFENINSSELYQVEGINNGADSITASTTNVVFTNTKDDQGVWDDATNRFQPLRDTTVLFTGAVYIASPQSDYQVKLYNDNSFLKICGYAESSSRVATFSCEQDVVAGGNYSIRINKTINLSASTGFHHLYIQEIPDTESIIKNLSKNKTLCQTKYLSSNAVSDGTLTDLGFSGLDTSKYYSLTMQYSFVYNTNNTCSIAYSDGAVTFLSGIHRGADAPADRTKSTAHISFHKPATSTLTATFDENTACTLEGNGLKSQTWAILCELDDSVISTTEF